MSNIGKNLGPGRVVRGLGRDTEMSIYDNLPANARAYLRQSPGNYAPSAIRARMNRSRKRTEEAKAAEAIAFVLGKYPHRILQMECDK